MVSNGLDPDQDRHFVSPDLDPNCLQRLSTCWEIFRAFVVDICFFQNKHFQKIFPEHYPCVKKLGCKFGSKLTKSSH